MHGKKVLLPTMVVFLGLTTVLAPAGPAVADGCSGAATPCSPRCVRLGDLYDRRSHALERVYRKLTRNSRRLEAAQERQPVNEAQVARLQRRDRYLRRLYDKRRARLMRTYRKYLRTCF